MPSKGNGAIGSLEFTKEERKALALKSVEAPPKYGTPERQKVINEIHEEMVRRMKKPSSDANQKTDCEIAGTENESQGLREEQSKVDDGPHALQPVCETQSTECTQLLEAARAQSSTADSQEARSVPPARPVVRQQASDDQFLTLLAIGLFLALAALLFKKFYHSFSWISFE